MFDECLKAEQKNNAVDNNGAKYALKEYSEHQVENWKNSKRIVVYESQNQLQQFIDDARAHKNLNKKMYFGIISDETADFIKQKTDIDVSNCNVSLRADSIIKIFNDHGREVTELPRGQRPIIDQDILKLPQLLGSIDYAVNAGAYTGMSKDSNSTFLNLRSNLDDSITIGAFKQGKYLDLRIHTMYAKRGNYATTADANAPASTSKTSSGKVSSNSNVPQNDTVVNNSNMQNEPYIVSFVVNEFTNEVKSIDVLYSVNAKKEPAGSSKSPKLSTASTGSTISISDLLDYVNRYYPDILPEDVLRHYGYSARPDGVIGESALYSRKESVDVDEFGEEDYNYPKLGKAEYNHLKSEILTNYPRIKNVENVINLYSSNSRYYYILDDEYNITVLAKTKMKNIHRRKDYKNVDRKGNNISGRFEISERRYGFNRDSNGRNGDRRTAGFNDKFIEEALSSERQSNQRRYSENGIDDFEEDARYSIKEQPIDYNTILQENDELAQMNEDLKHMLKITFIWIFKLLNLCTIYS